MTTLAQVGMTRDELRLEIPPGVGPQVVRALLMEAAEQIEQEVIALHVLALLDRRKAAIAVRHRE